MLDAADAAAKTNSTGWKEQSSNTAIEWLVLLLLLLLPPPPPLLAAVQRARLARDAIEIHR
jgi:hypothetical protein